jgi:hypothetical protein
VNAQARPAWVQQQSVDENGQQMTFTECFNYNTAGAVTAELDDVPGDRNRRHGGPSGV